MPLQRGHGVSDGVGCEHSAPAHLEAPERARADQLVQLGLANATKRLPSVLNGQRVVLDRMHCGTSVGRLVLLPCVCTVALSTLGIASLHVKPCACTAGT